MKGRFIVVSGPSGVGKGTICKRVIDELGAEYSVSYTTREPRVAEIDGVNYNFISREEFERKIAEGDFLEYNIYNGNYYGTGKSKILEKLDEGINVILEIDVNGGRNVKKICPDALLIYIAPPSMEELRKRLIDRGTEDMEKINNRLKIAQDEMKEVSNYDYIVVNDDLDKAVLEVERIIKGEKN